MSAQGVNAAVDRITDALYNIAISVLEDDTVSVNSKVNKNTLTDSQMRVELYALPVSTTADVVIQALFNNYVVYLEWDRPPRYKKAPPISALKDWAEKNGIETDAGTLYAISYAIWRDGHKGRPIFATIDKLADKEFTNVWADDLFTTITETLDELFND